MMPHEPGEELLDYQTEAEIEPEPAAPGPPIPVEVCGPVVTLETVPQHATAYTVVVTTDGPAYDQLLPLDPLRVRATIWATGQAAVICHSLGQAQDPANTETDVPNPAGALLPTGQPIVITGGQQMWVAATAATASQVSVIVERRDA